MNFKWIMFIFIFSAVSLSLTTPAFAAEGMLCKAIFDTPSSTGTETSKSTQTATFTQVERDAFITRAKAGDIDAKLGRDALVTAEELSLQMREPIVGRGLLTCYQKFGGAAVSTVHRLLIAARGALNPRELHSRIVSAYAKIFTVTDREAERRVCTLSDGGPIGTPECGIFGRAVAEDCRL